MRSTPRATVTICRIAFGLALGNLLSALAVFGGDDLPWTPQYKRGGTPADIVGPDGIAYPNWTRVGVQGGIPSVAPFASVEQFGARADDNQDDAESLQKACDAAGTAGGGAILFGKGTYHLDRKTTILHNGVVIRGQGREHTRLVVRYNASEDTKEDGIILFAGRDTRSRHLLRADAARGSTSLALERAGTLRAGTWLRLHAPATPAWRQLLGGVSTPYDPYRRCMVHIVAGGGDRVDIAQPLRIDFPLRDGSWADTTTPIERCGIEALSLSQAQKSPKIQTVLFRCAVNCWARGVRVDQCGRNPVYAINAKWITIRDCEFHGTWDSGGGGTGYVGFEGGWDCLMEDVTTSNLRHAPCLEWGSSGCVFRNSTFVGSDAQCHSGWCHENLFENCVVTRPAGHGGYGHGFFTTSPTDKLHGPIGPRNVLYNCDFTQAPKSGLVLNGMNENWIVLYNRFESEDAGIVCNGVNFDHIIAHNVFVVRGRRAAMVTMNTANPQGIELRANSLYGGNGAHLAGNTAGVTATRNVTHPAPQELPPRPQPLVASIYEWQQQHAAHPRNAGSPGPHAAP